MSLNYSVDENSGPPKSCTLDIWPVTSKRLPNPALQAIVELLKICCGKMAEVLNALKNFVYPKSSFIFEGRSCQYQNNEPRAS